MPGKTTVARHEALMTQMASTLGVDLDEAELKGALPPEIREDLLLACTGCSDPTACAKWLSRTSEAEHAPDYCRNSAILSVLAAE